MEAFKDLGNVSESIMIRELQKRLYGEKEDKEENVVKETVLLDNKEEGDSKIKCVFCGSKKNLHKYMNNYYCHKCYKELQKVFRNDS